MSAELLAWSKQAVNLVEHADNPVHTDAGARAAGYRSAIVAGTTVYAYLTHPPAQAWGLDWVGGGGAEVRLVAAVLDQDKVDCIIESDGSNTMVEARVGGELKATCSVWLNGEPPAERSGESLETVELLLDDARAGYGLRAGDDLPLYEEHGIVHPAAWLTISNQVFLRFLVDGPWVHTRSRVTHHGVAPVGSRAIVESTVVDRFQTRAGARAVVDIRIAVEGQIVATIEHEALVALA